MQLARASDAEAADEQAVEAAKEAVQAAALAQDQATVRALRMALRSITMKLLGNRRWSACALPVDPDDNPDFYERVGHLPRPQQPLLELLICARREWRGHMVSLGLQHCLSNGPSGSAHMQQGK